MGALNGYQKKGSDCILYVAFAFLTTSQIASVFPLPTAYMISRGHHSLVHDYRPYDFSIVSNAPRPYCGRPLTLSGTLALPQCASFTTLLKHCKCVLCWARCCARARDVGSWDKFDEGKTHVSGDYSVLHKVRAHAGVGGHHMRTVSANELIFRTYSNHSRTEVPSTFAWALSDVGCGSGPLLYILTVIMLPAVLAFVHAGIFWLEMQKETER
jgi:hypothetical protein